MHGIVNTIGLITQLYALTFSQPAVAFVAPGFHQQLGESWTLSEHKYSKSYSRHQHQLQTTAKGYRHCSVCVHTGQTENWPQYRLTATTGSINEPVKIVWYWQSSAYLSHLVLTLMNGPLSDIQLLYVTVITAYVKTSGPCKRSLTKVCAIRNLKSLLPSRKSWKQT